MDNASSSSRPNSGFHIPPPSRGEDGAATLNGNYSNMATPRRGSRSVAEEELRQVAEMLSRTGKALTAGLSQATEQGQRLRGAISRLERSNEWSSAERKRAEDEVSGFFNTLREALRTKEDEILRDIRGVYAVQDEENKRRLEELVIQGQKLAKACQAVQGLNEGTSNATLGSINTPLNALLESLEASGRLLDREDESNQLEAPRHSSRGRPGTGETKSVAGGTAGAGEERGCKFHFCNDQEIQRKIDSIEMVQYSSSIPPTVLVGTPAAIEENARRLVLSKADATRVNGPENGFASSRSLETDFGSIRIDTASPNMNSDRKLYGSQTGMSRFSSSPNSTSGVETGSLKIKAVVPFDDGDDRKGVLHYLGSRGGNSDFSNPALLTPDDSNLVILRASSRIEGDLASLAGYKHHDGAFFETDSALSSWVSVELPHLLAPTHYTLGYFINGRDHIPRNWVLQGSKDGETFHTLRVHENDMSLDGDLHLASWRINTDQANEAGPFRFFRIMQTGPTSTGTMFLVLSFIEFFGTLLEGT